MSTQDNIEYIKKELSSQEKLLDGLFAFERFYKKRKKSFLAGIVFIVIVIIALFAYNYMENQNNIQANISFNYLTKNGHDKKHEDILKKYNPTLYGVYKFKTMINSSDISNKTLPLLDIPILKDLFEYQKAISGEDMKLLDKYSLKQQSTLKDFALLSEVFLLIEQNKIQDAKDKLKFMPATSPLGSFVGLINHYLITK